MMVSPLNETNEPIHGRWGLTPTYITYFGRGVSAGGVGKCTRHIPHYPPMRTGRLSASARAQTPPQSERDTYRDTERRGDEDEINS